MSDTLANGDRRLLNPLEDLTEWFEGSDAPQIQAIMALANDPDRSSAHPPDIYYILRTSQGSSRDAVCGICGSNVINSTRTIKYKTYNFTFYTCGSLNYIGLGIFIRGVGCKHPLLKKEEPLTF
jgi:hypothetical protein